MPNTRAIGVAYRDQEISGGSVDNSPIGATTPSTGSFTTLNTSGTSVLGDAAGDLVGFHGGNGTAQATYVPSITALALSVSGVVGFTSSTSVSALRELVVGMHACLVSHGLMAAS